MTRRYGFLLCGVLIGCTPDAPAAPRPTNPEHDSEISVSASEIEASWTAVDEHLVSPYLEAPEGATRVGALVRIAEGTRPPILEARADEGAWQPLTVTWSETHLFVARTDLERVAHRAQLRIRTDALRTLEAITWTAVVPEPPARAEDAPTIEGDIGVTHSALDSVFVEAGIVSREAWGARAATCSTTDPNKWRIAIHHTATPPDGDPAENMRAIQAFHMDTRGWCDIGYHFLISMDGQVWEGRPIDFMGAHVLGSNDGNVGISLIGCFQPGVCDPYPPLTPPDVMIDSAVAMVRLVSDLYAIPVRSDTVMGHRDYPAQATSCPGDNLHALLDSIRARANLPSFAAEVIDENFAGPVRMRPGDVLPAYVEVRNTGYSTWRPGETFLGPSLPHDAVSLLGGPDWVSDTRAATIDRVVPWGETGRFEFNVHAPTTPGDYTEYFNLVEEGVAWFSDPDQGGPADDVIAIDVVVTEHLPPRADMGGGDAGVDAGVSVPLSGDCGCRAAGASSRAGMAIILGGKPPQTPRSIATPRSAAGRSVLALALVALLISVRTGARSGSRTTRRRARALRR